MWTWQAFSVPISLCRKDVLQGVITHCERNSAADAMRPVLIWSWYVGKVQSQAVGFDSLGGGTQCTSMQRCPSFDRAWPRHRDTDMVALCCYSSQCAPWTLLKLFFAHRWLGRWQTSTVNGLCELLTFHVKQALHQHLLRE